MSENRPDDPHKQLKATFQSLRSGLRALGTEAGRYLGNISFLGTALLIYVVCSVATWFFLSMHLGTPLGRAATIAYDVSTGESPTNYSPEIKNPVLWFWLGFFHVLAWLIVPILTATLVDIALRLRQEDSNRVEKRFRLRIRNEEKLKGALKDVSEGEMEAHIDGVIEYMETELVHQKSPEDAAIV